jgi:hypothetical protein
MMSIPAISSSQPAPVVAARGATVEGTGGSPTPEAGGVLVTLAASIQLPFLADMRLSPRVDLLVPDRTLHGCWPC